MTKPAPTLADMIIREWQRPFYRQIDPNNWLASHIAQARKFVLDESMSTFLADLGYSSLRLCNTKEKRCQLIEGIRQLSRLPHALTWIEYDKQAHRRRVKEAYHSDIIADFDSVPDRSGWLLMQHPSLETSFMALHCTSHSWEEGKRVDKPNSSQFAVAWSSDDSIPPWPRDPHYHRARLAQIGRSDEQMLATPAGILTGVLEYTTDTVSAIAAPHITPKVAELYARQNERYFSPIGELSHDLRYLWSLLATINELPTSRADIKQDRGYVSRGRYRKFSDHTVISLTIPVKRYQAVARRAIAIARRRGHQVRGHWRKDRYHPGERIWIREHVRGDTSLGFVIHDYVVERGEI